MGRQQGGRKLCVLCTCLRVIVELATIQKGLEPFQEGKNGNCLDFYQGIFPGAERQPERQHGTLSRTGRQRMSVE